MGDAVTAAIGQLLENIDGTAGPKGAAGHMLHCAIVAFERTTTRCDDGTFIQIVADIGGHVEDGIVQKRQAVDILDIGSLFILDHLTVAIAPDQTKQILKIFLAALNMFQKLQKGLLPLAEDGKIGMGLMHHRRFGHRYMGTAENHRNIFFAMLIQIRADAVDQLMRRGDVGGVEGNAYGILFE